MAVDEREGVGVGGGEVAVSLGSGFGEDFFLPSTTETRLAMERRISFGRRSRRKATPILFCGRRFFRLCGVGVGVGDGKIF